MGDVGREKKGAGPAGTYQFASRPVIHGSKVKRGGLTSIGGRKKVSKLRCGPVTGVSGRKDLIPQMLAGRPMIHAPEGKKGKDLVVLVGGGEVWTT